MVLIFFFRAIRGKEENREPAGKDLMHSFFPIRTSSFGNNKQFFIGIGWYSPKWAVVVVIAGQSLCFVTFSAVFHRVA